MNNALGKLKKSPIKGKTIRAKDIKIITPKLAKNEFSLNAQGKGAACSFSPEVQVYLNKAEWRAYVCHSALFLSIRWSGL